MDDKPMIQPETRAQWRAWLEANHRVSSGVFMVSWKRRTGRPAVPYEEAVEEALCFGWIDGPLGRGESDLTRQWFAPRRPRSTWARSNKERVARLEAAGLMTTAGLAAVERARANGSWTALDDIDNLVMPSDLDAALAARPGARETWDGYSPSSRRMTLAWVTQVKRPDLRARRVERVADQAARGERVSDIFRTD
jgi:uncharacterized protein YdeI (YjbR/CyaY-like superfamily)